MRETLVSLSVYQRSDPRDRAGICSIVYRRSDRVGEVHMSADLEREIQRAEANDSSCERESGRWSR